MASDHRPDDADASRRAAGAPLVPPPRGTAPLIERAIVLLLLGGLLAAIIMVLWPLATAIMFAAILANATWPIRTALVHLGLPRTLVGVLMALTGIVLVGLPVVAVAPRLATRVAEGAHLLEGIVAAMPQAPPDWIGKLPLIGDRLSSLWREVTLAEGDVKVLIAPYAGWLRQTVIAVAGALADSAMQFLLALIVAGMFWANGDAVRACLRDVILRIGGSIADRALVAAGEALRSVAYGVVGTACVQALLMGVGAAIAGVPAPGALGFVALLLAISQIGAPLLVVLWGGAAWWLFNAGDTAWGVFMIVWGLVLVSTSDNILRTLLISRGMEMPMTLVIIGVFGGFLGFGFLGLFVGPAVLAVAFTLLQAWRGVEPRRSG